MSNALLAGVSGLKAHQTMLDVAGSNLANINTAAYKSSRVTFADMLSRTLKEAGQPTTAVGGTNPMQIGSGVTVTSVDRDMTQGSLINTGRPLDMAIEGPGYFVLNDGQKDVYTRVGSFAVDSNFYLVDPANGYRVQRIGSEGVSDGFQDAADSNIRIPFDVALPAAATTTVSYTGNLSADRNNPTTHLLTSSMQYTDSGAVAATDTLIEALDQVTTPLADGDDIDITVTQRDGTPASGSLNITLGTTDVQDLLDEIDTLLAGQATASLYNGEIRITEAAEGYSQVDVELEMDGAATGAITFPKYFTILVAGGEESKGTNVEIFDSQGISHILSATFVRRTLNEWDLVLTSITGDVDLTDRRIEQVSFQANGSYGGLAGTDTSAFTLTFPHDPTNVRTINMNLGTAGEFGGLCQFGGASTVAPSGQNGYASGDLTSVSATSGGVLVGVFSNGIRRDVAAMELATFQNPAALLALSDNYFEPSANSGDPIPTKALEGGAGAVQGSSLERSNVEVASQFVDLIQAQNGFQANARTIRIANEMLRDLATLIR